MSDTRTQAQKDAAQAILKGFIKRQKDAQEAKGKNPLQQPRPQNPLVKERGE